MVVNAKDCVFPSEAATRRTKLDNERLTIKSDHTYKFAAANSALWSATPKRLYYAIIS